MIVIDVGWQTKQRFQRFACSNDHATHATIATVTAIATCCHCQIIASAAATTIAADRHDSFT
jgi:hypothetical protein